MNHSSVERWLPIPGYEGLYEVSDHGRCRSLDRMINHSRGGLARCPGQLLNGSVDKNGRRRYRLSRNGEFKRIQAHRAVLLAFVGPAPEGTIGCHEDDDALNNHLSNLRWDTPSANSYDAIRNGVHPKGSMTHCAQGHRFVPASTYRHHGRRKCKACHRGKSVYDRSLKRGVAPPGSLQELRDRAYEDILAGRKRNAKAASGFARNPRILTDPGRPVIPLPRRELSMSEPA